MAFSLQKANFFKRFSAWLFDAVMCVVLVMGMLIVMSAILNYDFQHQKLSGIREQYYAQYEAEHEGVNLDPTNEEFDAYTEEEVAAFYDHLGEVEKLIGTDEEYQQIQLVIMNYTFLMVTVSLLIADAVWHFIIPMILGDGRTLGKKIFGLAVIRTNGLKLSNPILFVRSILGLFTMETMVPLFFAMMVYFGGGFVGVIAAFMLLVLEIAVMATTKTHSSIHCLLSDTVVVDFASQQIFQTQEELNAALEADRLAEEERLKSGN